MVSLHYGGIDPGLSGAVVFCTDENLMIIDMPVVAGEVSLSTLTTMLLPYRENIGWVYVERVHAMPRQGVSSMFKFGVSYGGVLGVATALNFPITRIEPSVWKRAVGLPPGAPKELSVKRAQEIFPQHAASFIRPKQRGSGYILLDGRAEAALIAWHCRRECRDERL